MGDNLAASAVKNRLVWLSDCRCDWRRGPDFRDGPGCVRYGYESKETKKQNRGDENLTIEIAGAEVESGMWIWVDDDGAVLLPEPPPKDAPLVGTVLQKSVDNTFHRVVACLGFIGLRFGCPE